MKDIITNLNHCVIQHGKSNDRIYLMKFDILDKDNIIMDLDNLAITNKYSKIFAKVPDYAADMFQLAGYNEEATIPKFYRGENDCVLLAKYYDKERSTIHNQEELDKVLDTARSKAGLAELSELDIKMQLRLLNYNDINDIVEVYKAVFESYPFPIFDPDYILETMQENVVYYGIYNKDKLFAVSSSELSPEYLNAEMTDFAILPEYRGSNYALNLLIAMEEELLKQGYKTLYTIARAVSYGMNITFSRLNYTYSGTLINNTNISGTIESMNIWYKSLSLPR